MPAVQTCSHLCCIQEAIHFRLSAIKKIRLHPKWIQNLTFNVMRSILNRWKKKVNSATKISLLASVPTGPYNPGERKILSANWKTNQSSLIECCLVSNTYKVKVWEATIYLFWPAAFVGLEQCCFAIVKSWPWEVLCF